jgi:hypothetical protein
LSTVTSQLIVFSAPAAPESLLLHWLIPTLAACAPGGEMMPIIEKAMSIAPRIIRNGRHARCPGGTVRGTVERTVGRVFINHGLSG